MRLYGLMVLPVLVAGAQAQVSEEVSTIAFASFAPIKTTIFIADGDGDHPRPLLAKPDLEDCNPSFSHDGRWIVFTSYRSGSADIYRVHPDGSGLDRLTNDPAFDDQGALSPDGQSLAFVSTRGGRANIWILDTQSRKLKNLTPGSSGDFRPAWSPDGESIAFSSDRDSTHPRVSFTGALVTEVYVMRRDGSDVRQITRGSNLARSGSPSWSPDGSRIVYYETTPPGQRGQGTRIASVEWKTGVRLVLKDGPDLKTSPRWLSPSRIAYVTEGTSSGIERTEGPAGARGEFRHASWSPDGKTMVFDRQTDSSWPPFQSWPSFDAGYNLIRTGVFPSFSPSGDRLVSNSASTAGGHNSILMMNADGTNRKMVFNDPQRNALAPVWSPRGDHIAFGLGEFFRNSTTRQDVTSQLAIIRSNGSGLRLLSAAGDHAGFPSWSPDGKRLVYAVSSATGKGLHIIDLDNEQVIDLTTGTSIDNFPSWSPLGGRIAFTSNRDGDYEIYTIQPDGSDLKRLTQSPGNDAHPAWSPDGKWIAFVSVRSGFKDEGHAQQDGEIFVMRADGSGVRQLTENPFEDGTPAWMPSKAAGH